MLQVGDFSITLKASPRNKHFRVMSENGVYVIGQQSFDTLDDLVEHYARHPIYRNRDEKLYLLKPLVHPADSGKPCLNTSQAGSCEITSAMDISSALSTTTLSPSLRATEIAS